VAKGKGKKRNEKMIVRGSLLVREGDIEKEEGVTQKKKKGSEDVNKHR